MHEDGKFFGDEGDIRSPRNAFVVETVAAKARVPEGFAECDLGSRILCAVGAHYPRDSRILGRWRSFVADVFDESIVTERRGCQNREL